MAQIKCILAEQAKGGSSGGIYLKRIAVTTQPTTSTGYYAGDIIDWTGMVVTGTYGTADVDISTATVTGWQASHTTIPSSQGTGNLTVTITATDSSGNTAETTVTIGTIKKLTGLTITTAPTATQTYGSAASKSGAIGRATYSNGSTKIIDANSLTLESPTGNWGVVGSQTMTLGYTETTSIKGSTTKYTADTTVTVNKAAQSITLNPTSVSINASNYSSGVAVSVTRLGDGAVSVSGSVTGLSATVSGTTVTVTGNGSTATSTTFTVSVAEGAYYLAGTATFTATAAYWNYSDTTVDETWFKGLNSYLESHTNSEIASLIHAGDEKTVTLSSSVLGTTTHKIRVIGVNQDGDQCVTFQTKNALNDYTTFSTSSWSTSNYDSARWLHSSGKARAECLNYRNAFPGKKYIRALARGTSYNTDQSRGESYAAYAPETVYLLSERELGLDTYSPITVSNGSTNCTNECAQGKDFAYSYFTGNDKRIFNKGDSSTSSDGYPWERSRYAGSNSNYRGFVCLVTGNGAAGGYHYGNSNGLAPAFVIGNGSIWGDPYELATASWFEALADWLAAHTNEEIAKSIKVGMCKRVSLSSAVLGTTDHWIRVIGVNQDMDKSITFQTVNSLATATTWSSAAWDSGSSNEYAKWTDSNCLARQNCEAYYNAFPGKAYIKTVSKGICVNTAQTRSGISATYMDMNVFLLSEYEAGLDSYAPITRANSTTTNAECTYGKLFTYEFYNNNGSRIKKLGDGDVDRQYWWERSRYAGGSSIYRGIVCSVNIGGAANIGNYDDGSGLAPAFVIGAST